GETKMQLPWAVIGRLDQPSLDGCKREKNKAARQADTNKGTEKRIQLVRDDAQNKVAVMIEGKLFTAYLYPDNMNKPILYPLITPQGSNILRKYPMEPSVGERVDHPHQVGDRKSVV